MPSAPAYSATLTQLHGAAGVVGSLGELGEVTATRSPPRAMDLRIYRGEKTLRAGSRLFTRLRSSSAMADSRGTPSVSADTILSGP